MTTNKTPDGEITYGPIPVQKVLNAARSRDLSEVLVLGFETDGTFYAASSSGKISDNLLLLEKCRFHMMVQSFDV